MKCGVFLDNLEPVRCSFFQCYIKFQLDGTKLADGIAQKMYMYLTLTKKFACLKY